MLKTDIGYFPVTFLLCIPFGHCLQKMFSDILPSLARFGSKSFRQFAVYKRVVGDTAISRAVYSPWIGTNRYITKQHFIKTLLNVWYYSDIAKG